MGVIKSEIQLIVRYLSLFIKSWLLWVILFLDLLGIILVYNTNFRLPIWVLICIPILAILITSYSIFKNSSPKIIVDKPLEDDFVIDFNSTYTYNNFNIKFETYIRNFGLQSGSLEFIKLNFVGVNGIKDEFILRNMEINSGNFVICNEKNKFMLAEIKDNYRVKFPMILKPDTMKPIYFMIPLQFSSTFETNVEMLDWVKKIHFELEYKTRDGYGSELKKVPFNFKVDNLLKLIDGEMKEREKIEKAFARE